MTPALGTTGVNHIHVAGNAQRNLLFVVDTGLILGLVGGHLESGMSSPVRNEAQRVMNRRSEFGSIVDVKLNGNQLLRT